MNPYFDLIHNGIPIDDIEFIDIHAHLGPYGNMHIPLNDVDGMVFMKDTCGIDKTVVGATPACSSDFVWGNNLMREAIKKHRGRIYGAVVVNGNYPERSVDELDLCFAADRHVIMIKIHPNLACCKLDDRRMKGIYRFAVERKLFVLVHTWLDNDDYGNQDLFAAVAKDYPDIRWIMGHSGGPFGGVHAVELAQKVTNIYLDLTLSIAPARQIEFFVKEVGADRVMFGTDNPFIDPRPQVGRLCLASDHVRPSSCEYRSQILGCRTSCPLSLKNCSCPGTISPYFG